MHILTSTLRRSRAIIIVYVALYSVYASNSFAAHPLKIEDQLRIETIGQGAADPTGSLVVWEQSPPYDKLPDYSYGETGTWDGSFGPYHLMSLAIRKPGATVHPLFRPDPKRLYWFDSFSPNGRFVLFYSEKLGRMEMGTYDIRSRKIHYFGRAPTLSREFRNETTWVSPDVFVYSAFTGNTQPEAVIRRSYGRAMWAAWNKSWAGKESVTAVVSSSHSTGVEFKPGELILANAKTGGQDVLGQGSYDTITVSRDGRYLAALREVRKPPSDYFHSSPNFTEDQRSQLIIFDLKSTRLPSVIAPDIDVCPESLAWAHDQDHLAFFGWPTGGDAERGLFRVLDAGTGQIIPYPHLGLDLASQRERAHYQKPERPVWVGDELAMFARQNAVADLEPHFTPKDISGTGIGRVGKADWFLVDRFGAHKNLTTGFKSVSAIPLNADGRSLTVLADNGVWRLSATSPPVNVAEGAKHPVALADKTPRRRPSLTSKMTLAGLTTNGAAIGTDFLDEDSGRLTEVPSPPGNQVLIASSAVSHKLLFRQRDGTGDVIELEDEAGHVSVVSRLNTQLNDVIHTHWSLMNYSVQTPTGPQPVAACVLLPVNYQNGHHYPAIVNVYPEQNGSRCLPNRRGEREIGFSGVADFDHLLAAHGYIVFEPDTEDRFTRTSEGPIWAMPDVVVQGVDALTSQGFADPNRLGLFGYSQGGVSSLWVASKTNIFKAVVSMNGWSDYYTHFFEPSYSMRGDTAIFQYSGNTLRFMSVVGGPFGFGKSPSQAPNLYTSNSPLLRADSMNAPILLIHSDMDGFSMAEYEAMFTALNLNRKEAKLLEYWGEGHSPSSPENMRNMWQNIFDWYDKYLVDGNAKAANPSPPTPN